MPIVASIQLHLAAKGKWAWATRVSFAHIFSFCTSEKILALYQAGKVLLKALMQPIVT